MLIMDNPDIRIVGMGRNPDGNHYVSETAPDGAPDFTGGS